MENLYNFEEYVNESYAAGIAVTVKTIAFEGLFESSYLTPTEKIYLKKIINECNNSYEMLDESFIGDIRQAIKDAKDKGLEIAKKVGDDVMTKLENLAKSASDFTAYITDKIKAMWDWASTKYAAEKDKHKQAIKAALLKNKDQILSHKEDLQKGLATDIAHLKETLLWWKDQFIKFFADKMKEVLSKILLKESLTWKGETILEFVNFNIDSINENEGKFGWLSKIVHTLSKIPPFSYLASVREKLTGSFKTFLSSISDITKKMGGPGVYDFAALGILLGALGEYAIKKLTVGAAMNVIPFAGTLVHVLGYVALGLLFIEVVEELMKTGELTGSKQEAKPEEKAATAEKPTADKTTEKPAEKPGPGAPQTT
jgi:hypothetical protein